MISTQLRAVARSYMMPRYRWPTITHVPTQHPAVSIPKSKFSKPQSAVYPNFTFQRLASSTTTTTRVALHSSIPHMGVWMKSKYNILRLATWGSAGATTLLAISEIGYTYFTNRTREQELTRAFSKGSVPLLPLENFVERPGSSKAIAALLQPPAGYGSYNMIVGYHGTGKTTLVRHVGHQYPGIIYVNVASGATSEEHFAQAFAKGVHWSPPRQNWVSVLLTKCGITTEDNTGKQPLWDAAFAEFLKRAETYRKSSGHSAVLVIDNVNRLAVDNPSLLKFLQDLAKDAADERAFITVFVTSEGQAQIQMLERSASSRLGKIVTIGDITAADVHTFLQKTSVIPHNVAQEIYSIVGGRINYINQITQDLDNGTPWEEIRQQLLTKAQKNFKRAKLSEGGEHYEIGLRIAARILDDGHIHEEEFDAIAGSLDVAEFLLSSNVFGIMANSVCVTFCSKPTEHIARTIRSNFLASQKPTPQSGHYWSPPTK